jgi:phenylalanyl-tRNA synthetase beta chain
VRLRRARAQRLLGIEFTAQQIAGILHRLGFAFDAHGDEFLVTPPSYRFDFTIEEDMIEEVARIHGYDKIPANPPIAAAAMLPAPETRIGSYALRGLMVARDYQEIVSYSFIDRRWEIDFCANHDPVALANPIAAHLNVMRSSLIPSLVDCLRLNLSRQQERVRLFETGRCFSRAGSAYEQVMMLGGLAYGEAAPEQWGVKGRKVDFYDVKSDVEAVIAPNIARFETAQHPALHPGRSAKVTLHGVAIGWVGELHPRLQQEYDFPYASMVFELNLDRISTRNLPVYRETSRQPLVRRDLSVEVPESVNAQAMLDALRKYAQRHVFEVALFDVYRGKGIDSDKKSIAFKVLLQDTDKTLTDAEVETAIGQMLHVLQEQFQAKLRK